MASIIQPSDFYGDINLAQIGSPVVQADVQKYIDKYEQEYLLNMLGYELKQRFDAGAVNDIKNGKEYYSRCDATILQKWRGLVMKDGSSPIASYIFVMYMKDQWSKQTGVGEKKLKSANASNADMSYKLIKQWNWMVERNRELVDFLLSDQVAYEDYYRYWQSYRWMDLGFDLTVMTHGIY